MKIRNIILLSFFLIFYLPLIYVFLFEPNLARSYTFAEIGPRIFFLIFLPPIFGIILWFWALYDWGTRRFKPSVRLAWLLTLVLTLYFGATVYFLAVGSKEPQTTPGVS